MPILQQRMRLEIGLESAHLCTLIEPHPSGKSLQTGNLGVSLTPGCFPPSISMEVVSGAKWPHRGDAPQLATLVRGSRCREARCVARFLGRRTCPCSAV